MDIQCKTRLQIQQPSFESHLEQIGNQNPKPKTFTKVERLHLADVNSFSYACSFAQRR
jgi:hypothetical protein